ncbi:hypothetical protein [Coxiella-like endosymbiont]|uniref:hypothetical protein n=1 Tax=Coxiella-like endosymbiont TaxID=1592897 RepID=UPI00272AAC75|nr:hypothetical protein [Coxiella-like endosymbiont]
MKSDGISLAVSVLTAKNSGPLLLIISDGRSHSDNRFRHALSFFTAENETPILHFPAWETLSYDHFSPNQDIVSERLLTLYQLPHLSYRTVVCAFPTLMQRLCVPLII